ncbi:unnamed protein product, partial [Adineta steineri]
MNPTLDDTGIEENVDLRSENILSGQQEYGSSHVNNYYIIDLQSTTGQQFQINRDVNESFSTRDLVVAMNISPSNQSGLSSPFGIISSASQNTSDQFPTTGTSNNLRYNSNRNYGFEASRNVSNLTLPVVYEDDQLFFDDTPLSISPVLAE